MDILFCQKYDIEVLRKDLVGELYEFFMVGGFGAASIDHSRKLKKRQM